MKVNYNKLLAVVYADLFDCPLTKEEMNLWSILPNLHVMPVGRQEFATNPSTSLRTSLHEYGGLIQNKDGYFFLKGRGKLVRGRKEREIISEGKLIKLIKLIKIIEKIPTVKGIFVTGSVAVGNSKKEADLDLMIVTSANCLWLTRGIVLMLLKGLKELRSKKEITDKICPNIFLDTSHLEVKRKNLYTAHEVLQAKCLFDRGEVERKWLEENGWVGELLPAFKKRGTRTVTAAAGSRSGGKKSQKRFPRVSGLILWFLIPLELLAYFLQFAYMRGKITNEWIGWGFAFFHPNDLSEKVLKKFSLRLKNFSLI